MKERTGFVSNSSSASYYVTLKGPIETVLLELSECCQWPYLSKDKLLERLNRDKRVLEIRLDDINTNREGFLIYTSRSYLEAKLNRIKEQIKEITEQEAGAANIYTALEIEGIQYTIAEGNLNLNCVTIMHNNYCEGMPDMLKDIVLFYAFENPDKLELKVEHHS